MTNSTAEIQVADASANFGNLSPDQTQRLTQLLDQYLQGLETGQPADVSAMLRENTDLADVLRAYLAKLDGLHGIAAGFRQHGELEPLVSSEPDSRVESLRLGDYKILRELGRGGMGIVYEAVQQTLHRRVALKVLPLASMLDASQIARFKNESHAAAQLQHANIVPVFSVGVERGIHFYAMQFIQGKSVDTWVASSLDRDSLTQWRETVRLAIDAAEALHCAHECAIVHRDIKPSNLMIDESGKIWVTDFGLARCQNDLSITASGHVVGTMRYMSPEQAAGRAELVDHRTDIYSLAVTLYEMLTGQTAVTGDETPSVLREIISGPPPRLRRFMPQLPADLEVVLQKAMSKEKDDRYATARLFGEDLQAVLDRRPTRAKPPSPAMRVSRWAGRHRELVAAASLVCLLGMVGLFASVFIVADKNRDLKASYQARDRSFRQAKETVDQMGSRVAARLASVPGAEQIRQALLQDTLAYYQEFVAHAVGDPQLQSELALTHSRIAALVKELESPQQSLPHYEQAAEIYRRLAEQSPTSIALARSRASNLNQFGLALLAAGDRERAYSKYQQAITLQRKLVAEQDSTQNRVDLALTRNNLGLLLREMSEVQLARVESKAAALYLDRVVEAEPKNVLAARGLAAALANLSSMRLDEQPSESIALLQQAIDQQLRISKESPNRLIASSEIATNYNNLGAAYLADRQPRNAVDAFSHATQILQRLHGIAPLVDAHRSQLAMSLNNLSTAWHRLGQMRQAREAAEEAISLQDVCLQDEVPVPTSLSRLAVMFNNLATALEAMDEPTAAIASYQAAVHHQQQAIAAAPQDAVFKSFLLQHYARLLRLQIRTGQWADAERTSGEYRVAAGQHPEKWLTVAEEFARLSKLAPAGSQRDRFVADLAATLAAARKSGVAEVDASLLQREPFREFAHLPSLRRSLQP